VAVGIGVLVGPLSLESLSLRPKALCEESVGLLLLLHADKRANNVQSVRAETVSLVMKPAVSRLHTIIVELLLKSEFSAIALPP
jgi:hypothetical protein